jgi:hypothetical protein
MSASKRRQTGSSTVAEIQVKQVQKIVQESEIIETLERVGSHGGPNVSKKHMGLTRPFSLAIAMAGIFIDTWEEYYKA